MSTPHFIGERLHTKESFECALDIVATQLDGSSCRPIQLISAGGFISTIYFGNRGSTEDLDYFVATPLSETELASLYAAVDEASKQLAWRGNWMNTALGITIPSGSTAERERWIAEALQQNVVLYSKGKITIYAAKWEWCIASKLKRMGTMNPVLAGFGSRNPVRVGEEKRKADLKDLVELFHHLQAYHAQKRAWWSIRGTLTRREIKDWYTDGPPIFDRILDEVAEAYRTEYGTQPFV